LARDARFSIIAADIRIFSLAPQSSNQSASKPRRLAQLEQQALGDIGALAVTVH